MPRLAERFEVLVVDLPGVGASPALATRPMVAHLTDAVERTLDDAGVGRVRVLWTSLGARLELARRGRALSVVAVSPSGADAPRERVLQGAGTALARVVGRVALPAIEPLSRSAVGRTLLLAPLKTRPWATSPEEALAVRDGFAASRDFWRTLCRGLLLDVPGRAGRSTCPVTLVQGTADWIATGRPCASERWCPGRACDRCWPRGHSPASDRPEALVRLVGSTAARVSAGT